MACRIAHSCSAFEIPSFAVLPLLSLLVLGYSVDISVIIELINDSAKQDSKLVSFSSNVIGQDATNVQCHVFGLKMPDHI